MVSVAPSRAGKVISRQGTLATGLPLKEQRRAKFSRRSSADSGLGREFITARISDTGFGSFTPSFNPDGENSRQTKRDCRKTVRTSENIRVDPGPEGALPSAQEPKMNPIACSGILFDMDGTLLDSNEASEITWQAWALDHNVEMSAIRKVHHGRRPEETISLVAPHLNAKDAAQRIYDDQLRMKEGVTPIAGALEFMRAVPAGRCGIVTAANQEILEHRFAIVGLPVPKVCVTAKILKVGKPDPEGYLLGAKLLGLAPADCVVFEDAPAGLLAARRAGMRSVAVLTNYTSAQLKEELGENYAPVMEIQNYLTISIRAEAESFFIVDK
ncbi:MAG: HAD family hydrolase [Proteobacteria bacterium]|nr:MAG: HAD family hydrolase [Pseudomonadota bacterium]